jgi:hypothetical protein
VLNKLIREYQDLFNEEIELLTFLDLDEEEQIKILEECITKKQKLYENDYFNDNYMEIVE